MQTSTNGLGTIVSCVLLIHNMKKLNIVYIRTYLWIFKKYEIRPICTKYTQHELLCS